MSKLMWTKVPFRDVWEAEGRPELRITCHPDSPRSQRYQVTHRTVPVAWAPDLSRATARAEQWAAENARY